MSKITPFIWIETGATLVVQHYQTIFGDSFKIIDETKMGEGERAVEIITFSLFDVHFRIMSAMGAKQINESYSMQLDCENQEEIDTYWESFLAAGGQEDMCGWLKDKFGISWQIVPKNMGELLSRPGVMRAMFRMKKLVISDLENPASE